MYHELSRSTGQGSRSQVKVTAWHNVTASKNAIIQTWISCRRSKLVKIIPEPSATLETCSNIIRSNTEIAITPPRIARLRSNLVQSFITSNSAADCSIAFKFGTEFHHITDDAGDTPQMFKVKGQKSRSRGQRSQSWRKVMYQRQKRYNTAMDTCRFSDFKLGMTS